MLLSAPGDISGTINKDKHFSFFRPIQALRCLCCRRDKTWPLSTLFGFSDAGDILPKWYQNSKQDWLFENLTVGRMPSKHGIKSDDYGGQLRRPGEKLEGSTTQDDVPQATSSVSNESENGENIALLLVMIVNFSISATVVFS